MKALKPYKMRRLDWLYLSLCAACSTISVMGLLSWCTFLQNNTDGVSYRVAIVQGGASFLGLALSIGLSFIDYHLLAHLWPLHAAASWALVMLTFVIGYSPLDTTNKAWLKLPMGMSLQPSELAKISFIVTFALHLYTVKEDLNRPGQLLLALAHMAVPAGIIHLQGDDGTVLIFLAIGISMLFAAGLSWKYIAVGIVGAGIALPLLWPRLENYQRERVVALFHQEDEEYARVLYQQLRGKIAIGSGQITGRGLFSGDHYYVPLAYNDFFFSYISQCLGFIGSMLVILLLLSICIRTIKTGLQAADTLGTYICVGVFAVILAQTVINLGMNLLLLPVIGVTLPFFSAGGTSVTMLYLCIGIVLSVYRHQPHELFEKIH